MVKKILVIQNPVAGKLHNKFNFDIMIKKLNKGKYDLTIKKTTPTEGADDIIRKEEAFYDMIFVCGGDGTLNQVVTEISNDEKKKKPIIYMPLGTTNDFARSLKTQKNRNFLLKPNRLRRKRCDTGKVNKDLFFNYIAATGMFTKAAYDTNRKAKRIFGRLAYIVNGMKELFHMNEIEATIYVNEQIIENKFVYISVSNSYSIGGFKVFKDNELDLNDGKFEILLIEKPKNFIQLFILGIHVFLKNHKDKNITFIQASDVKIITKENVNWTFDGEDSGKYNEIDISNINKNIEFII